MENNSYKNDIIPNFELVKSDKYAAYEHLNNLYEKGILGFTEQEKILINQIIEKLESFKGEFNLALPIIQIAFGTRGDITPVVNTTKILHMINAIYYARTKERFDDLVTIHSLLSKESSDQINLMAMETRPFAISFKEYNRRINIGANTTLATQLKGGDSGVSVFKAIKVMSEIAPKFVNDYYNFIESIAEDLRAKIDDENFDAESFATKLLHFYCSWAYPYHTAIINENKTPLAFTQATTQHTDLELDGILMGFIPVKIMRNPFLRRLVHNAVMAVVGYGATGNSLSSVYPNRQNILRNRISGIFNYGRGLKSATSQLMAFPEVYATKTKASGKRVEFLGYPNLPQDISVYFDKDLLDAQLKTREFLKRIENDPDHKSIVISPGSLSSKKPEDLTHDLNSLIERIKEKNIKYLILIGNEAQFHANEINRNAGVEVLCIPYGNFHEIFDTVDFGVLSGGNGTMAIAQAHKLRALFSVNFDDQRNARENIKDEFGIAFPLMDAGKWTVDEVMAKLDELDSPEFNQAFDENSESLQEAVGGPVNYENVLRLVESLVNKSEAVFRQVWQHDGEI